MATGLAFSPISGPAQVKTRGAWSAKSASLEKTPSLRIPRKSIHRRTNNLSVRALYNENRGGGGGEFISGFLLGGAIFGALGYVFSPQIRRSFFDEHESEFPKATRPIYYDDGLERNRETLDEKIRKLNSVIENISSRLRGGRKMPPPIPSEVDPEEATV
ncbi:unnamed protein product [Cuscuta campestris]|uniref:Uncharacterized protein n=2 Tax=Cuscuta sect. Cleistogrammica TaxID=1824901 RepID=A0A484NJ80_9ASTE|nr:hypothetical protein DM860_016589 [Cuscuta australis]VFR01050.1 unnamed protein product [Cuscuta campestris]